MKPQYVYRVEVVEFPAGSEDPDWCPEGWGGGEPFFWPSTKRIYKSRSAAVARKNLVEVYGATARILVSPIVWEDLDEHTRRQRLMRACVRADKLRRQADAIEEAAA